MLLAYESSVGGNGQNIFDRTCYRSAACFEPIREKKYHNRDLKSKFWSEVREKFNFTSKYSYLSEFQYNTNFKQRLLFTYKFQPS